jgi:hypothetical protein
VLKALKLSLFSNHAVIEVFKRINSEIKFTSASIYPLGTGSSGG